MTKTTNILDLNNRLEKVEKGNVAQNSYTSLKNKPKINNVTLTGNKSLSDIGAAAAVDLEELTSKLNKTSTTVNIDSTYDAGIDWNIVKQGNICVMNMRNLKDIPDGTTKIGNIPVGFRPESTFYEYVYSPNRNTNLGFAISDSGDVQILNGSGAALSGDVWVNGSVTYFT